MIIKTSVLAEHLLCNFGDLTCWFAYYNKPYDPIEHLGNHSSMTLGTICTFVLRYL